jgi:hypothetical protein
MSKNKVGKERKGKERKGKERKKMSWHFHLSVEDREVE